MDMFKLLTRSTNLKKPALIADTPPSIQLPSAGYHTHPLIQNDSLDECEKDVARGTKRKRNRLEGDYGQNSPGALDFKSETHTEIRLQKPLRAKAIASDKFQNVTKAENACENIELLNEDECRHTLKMRNLRITLLEKSSERKSNQKGPNTVIETPKNHRRKDINVQIYPQPLTSFGQLRDKYRVSKRLAENVDAQGYVEPTEVQLGSLPILLGSDKGRGLKEHGIRKNRSHEKSENDLIVVAPTGSGKTLAFMIHVLHGVLEDRQRKRRASLAIEREHEVQALIIVPTHELMNQITNEGRKMATGTGIKISAMGKGMRLNSNARNNDSNNSNASRDPNPRPDLDEQDSKKSAPLKADVVISTPLMLLHALCVDQDSMPMSLPTVRFLVLDEVDVLLDQLFREQTLGVWGACNNPCLRVSLWSATIGSSIESLAQTFILNRRQNLHLNSSTTPHCIIRLVVGLKDSAIPNLSHRLIYAASEQGKLLAFRQLMRPSVATKDSCPSLQPPFLVFTQTITRAIALHAELLYDIPFEAGGSSRIAVLHSDLSDTARSNIMSGFRRGEIWVLITTDLLSRGVDFRGVNGVVNYDLPNTGASYVHRVGRTGRQGRPGGTAVTLYTKEDIPYVKNIANVIVASRKIYKDQRGNGYDESLQQWLLDALPNVGKKKKKELKIKGVESRRPVSAGDGGRGARTMRISTKSGYDRRQQNKRRGALLATHRKLAADDEGRDSENQKWEIIEE